MNDKNVNKNDKAHLLLMRDAFAKIGNFTAGMSYEDFVVDGKTQSAVIMQLQIIGELAKKVPEEIKKMIDIPWRQMAGLRDLVAHDYFKLDLETVWRTAREAVPATETRLKEYLELQK